MIMSAARLAIVSVAFCIVTSGAVAQAVHPDCTRMRNKAGCTCALENGGGIRPAMRGSGPRWFSRRGRHTNDAFVQCMIRRGAKTDDFS